MSFRDRAEMFYVRSAQPIVAHAFTDNTMPACDWSAYDLPAKGRFTPRFSRIPVLTWSRSRRIEQTLKRVK